jgi:hypothetical protein
LSLKTLPSLEQNQDGLRKISRLLLTTPSSLHLFLNVNDTPSVMPTYVSLIDLLFSCSRV